MDMVVFFVAVARLALMRIQWLEVRRVMKSDRQGLNTLNDGNVNKFLRQLKVHNSPQSRQSHPGDLY